GEQTRQRARSATDVQRRCRGWRQQALDPRVTPELRQRPLGRHRRDAIEIRTQLRRRRVAPRRLQLAAPAFAVVFAAVRAPVARRLARAALARVLRSVTLRLRARCTVRFFAPESAALADVGRLGRTIAMPALRKSEAACVEGVAPCAI